MTTTHGHKALRSNRRTFRLLTFTFPFGERPVGSLERRAAARQDNRLATAMLLNQAVSAHPSRLEPLPRISIYFLPSVGQEAHLVTTNTSRLRFVPPRTDFESVFVGGISSPSALHYEYARWLLISASQINGHGGGTWAMTRHARVRGWPTGNMSASEATTKVASHVHQKNATLRNLPTFY